METQVNFCVLYPATLMNLFISSSIFLCGFLGNFYIYAPSCDLWLESVIDSFPNWMLLFALNCIFKRQTLETRKVVEQKHEEDRAQGRKTTVT